MEITNYLLQKDRILKVLKWYNDFELKGNVEAQATEDYAKFKQHLTILGEEFFWDHVEMAKSKRHVAKLSQLIGWKWSVLDQIFNITPYGDLRPTAKDIPRFNRLFTGIE